jgi:tRNA(Arg) A34 adenosine deaminase TadA
MQHEQWIREAVELGRRGMENSGGGPFGAVVVCSGRIVGRGWNQVTTLLDPTAHAEVSAIRDACQTLQRFELRGCDLYTSCEPCPMCLAAIYWARLDRIWFANARADAARIGFDDDLIYGEVSKPLEQRTIPTTQVMLPEAEAVFAEWAASPDRIRY